MTVSPDMLELVPFEEVKPKIFVGFALDQSGSMASIRKETISGVNEQIDDIIASAKNADVSVSLLTFASRGEWQYFNEPIDKLEKLTDENYVPSGSTAMYEGVGMMIDRLHNEVKSLTKGTYSVLLIVISDGDNNVNHPEYAPSTVSEKVKKLQDEGGWTFTYVGANQDLSKVQENLGIKAGNVMAFNASSKGANLVWADEQSIQRRSLRSYVTSASRGLSMQTSNFYDQPDLISDSINTIDSQAKISSQKKDRDRLATSLLKEFEAKVTK